MKIIIALLSLLVLTVTADAKCIKGKRVLDNATRFECHVLKGTWYAGEVRNWDRPKRRVARPPQ